MNLTNSMSLPVSVLAAALSAVSVSAADFVFDRYHPTLYTGLTGFVSEPDGDIVFDQIYRKVEDDYVGIMNGTVGISQFGSGTAPYGSFQYNQSLAGTFAAQQVTGTFHNESAFGGNASWLDGTAGFHFVVYFSVNQTTAFEGSVDVKMISNQTIGPSVALFLYEHIGDTTQPVFEFLPHIGAPPHDYSIDFSGILSKGSSYELRMSGGGWGDQVKGNLDFRLIPEPREWAALAGLGLLGFGMWRRIRR